MLYLKVLEAQLLQRSLSLSEKREEQRYAAPLLSGQVSLLAWAEGGTSGGGASVRICSDVRVFNICDISSLVSVGECLSSFTRISVSRPSWGPCYSRQVRNGYPVASLVSRCRQNHIAHEYLLHVRHSLIASLDHGMV